MEKSEENRALSVFTALEPLAIGGLIGLLLLVPLGQTAAGLNWAALVMLFVGLLALAVSLLHLGRPWRAPLAILHISASWLSREVVLFGLFLLAVLGYTVLPVWLPGHPVVKAMGIIAAACGLLAAIATGKTYRLHSRPAWDHWSTSVSILLGILSTGCLFGFFAANLFNQGIGVTETAWIISTTFLWVSLAVSLFRSFRRQETEEGRQTRQQIMGPHLWLLVLRVLAVILAFLLISTGEGTKFIAWIPALAGDLADRFLFFDTVVPVSLRKRFQ